jgi:hypothetical protein
VGSRRGDNERPTPTFARGLGGGGTNSGDSTPVTFSATSRPSHLGSGGESNGGARDRQLAEVRVLVKLTGSGQLGESSPGACFGTGDGDAITANPCQMFTGVRRMVRCRFGKYGRHAPAQLGPGVSQGCSPPTAPRGRCSRAWLSASGSPGSGAALGAKSLKRGSRALQDRPRGRRVPYVVGVVDQLVLPVPEHALRVQTELIPVELTQHRTLHGRSFSRTRGARSRPSRSPGSNPPALSIVGARSTSVTNESTSVPAANPGPC